MTPTEPRDLTTITAHTRALLLALGVDPTRLQTADTPHRWARALIELTRGLTVDPTRHLRVTFPPESDTPGLIAVAGIRFCSLCEHHMLPFAGTATVAYLPAPGAPIVGLSKLARLVGDYATRPQVQERLGEQIVTAITTRLDTQGAGCLIRSAHTCMTSRGVHAHDAVMVTSHLTGLLDTDERLRAELWAVHGT